MCLILFPEKRKRKPLATASSLTAVKFPLSELLLSKNSKLALLKQLGFLYDKSNSAFGSAEVLTHSCGNAFINSEAMASVKHPQRKTINV